MLTHLRRGSLCAIALATGLALPSLAFAQSPPPPPSSAPESAPSSGEPTVRGLDRLSPEDRAQAERNLQRWREMSPEQRQRAVDNYRQWQSLSPEERQTARQNDQRLRRMSPADRARVQEGSATGDSSRECAAAALGSSPAI